MSEYLGHMNNGSTITIITTGETISVPSDHLNFHDISEYLDDGLYEEAIELADISSGINSWGSGVISVQNGVVYYNDQPIHNSLTERILDMINGGYNADPLISFMENLMQNPSGRAVSELYRFLESNSLPITPDGYFLAYKNVRDDYYDKHSGKFRNMVGDVCQMDRNQVMDDPNQTCAPGLHFCSLEYLRGFWGTSGHTMIVKINPADVVSIPVDYNNSKGRCCRYEVVAEHTGGAEKDFTSDPVYHYGPETVYHNKRDSKGRFTK